MTDFIRRALRHSEISYRRVFTHGDSEHAGFAFPCDAEGHVDREALPERARANFDRCLAGAIDVVDRGMRVEEHRWTEPAAIRCPCGDEVELAGFTNPCSRCGRDYDGSGALLAPREQWGEETGESLADILRIR